MQTSLLAAFCRILTSLVRLYSGNHSPDRPLDLATGVARGLVAGFDVPAGAPLQFLVALVLDHSPLEVAVSWAASAVSECLETTTGLIEDRNETGLEAEKGSAKLGSDGPWKGAAERGMKGEKDGQLLVRGVTKRGVSPPQKSPDCEEAMRSWVENGGLKTEVPQLEDETGAVRESSASAPPVVRFATDGCRDQVLDLALRYLIRTVGRGAGADKDDGGETGEGHVAEDERGHVELGLEPLTQIIVAFTAVCDADVAVESKEELTEPGATRLLDERQSLRILRGVRAALGPVEEAVLWLSDLCGSAVLGAGKTDEADGLEETALGLSKLHGGEEPALGGSDVSANDLPAAGSLASERGLNGVPFDGVETAGDRSVSESREGIPSKDFANDEPAATVGPNIAYESGEGAGPPDASQVAAAAELVRLGARLHRAAEKLVGRKRGQWAGVSLPGLLSIWVGLMV